jgi:hypothetical protein
MVCYWYDGYTGGFGFVAGGLPAGIFQVGVAISLQYSLLADWHLQIKASHLETHLDRS